MEGQNESYASLIDENGEIMTLSLFEDESGQARDVSLPLPRIVVILPTMPRSWWAKCQPIPRASKQPHTYETPSAWLVISGRGRRTSSSCAGPDRCWNQKAHPAGEATSDQAPWTLSPNGQGRRILQGRDHPSPRPTWLRGSTAIFWHGVCNAWATTDAPRARNRRRPCLPASSGSKVWRAKARSRQQHPKGLETCWQLWNGRRKTRVFQRCLASSFKIFCWILWLHI